MAFFSNENHTLLFEILSKKLNVNAEDEESQQSLKQNILNKMIEISSSSSDDEDILSMNKNVISNMLNIVPDVLPDLSPDLSSQLLPLSKEDDSHNSQNFFEENAIIPPVTITSSDNKNNSLKPSIVLVDSRDRNMEEYPEPNQYTIYFPEEYRDIYSIELLNYEIPTSQFFIQKNRNNRLHFQTSFPQITVNASSVEIDYRKNEMQFVELQEGYYNGHFEVDEFCSRLQSALQAHTGSEIRVQYHEPRHRISFTTDFSDGFFQLFFKGFLPNTYLPQSIGNMIGFPQKDTDTLLPGIFFCNNNILSCNTNLPTDRTIEIQDWLFVIDIDDPDFQPKRCQIVEKHEDFFIIDRVLNISRGFVWIGRIESPWMCKFQPEPYIILKIKNIDVMNSTNNTTNKAFSYITTRKFNFENRESLTSIKIFNPIMTRLDRLEISFQNSDGTLYDFQGNDHVLVFLVNQLQQSINYSIL